MRLHPIFRLPIAKRESRALAAFAACITLLAQQQPAGPKLTQSRQSGGPLPGGGDTVIFTATSRLVVVPVTATDKNGKTIEGLSARDFTVTEDNVPQEIKHCDYQRIQDNVVLNPVPAVTLSTPALETHSGRATVDSVISPQISPEPPGDIRYRDRRLVVLYFDMGGMSPQDQLRAQAAAVKFISTEMQKPDLIAFISFSDGVHVLQDFTDDRKQLLEAVNRLFIGEGEGFEVTDNDASSADTGTAFGEDDSEFNIFAIDRQLAGLQTAVKMLGQLNEKKSLVYFASGLKLQGLDNQAQLQATTNAAMRANVTIFSVDARGLMAQAPMGDATHGSPGSQAMYSGASAMAFAANISKSQDTLYALAADTGGKALLDNNDLSQGIVEAEHAITNYYILGYYSTKAAADGKYRRIKITYNGDPSAKLTYRPGYWGPKTFTKFNAVDKERQLLDALELGDPVTELTIRMEIDYFRVNSAEYYVPVSVKIPGGELALAKRRGADHALIDFIGIVKDEYGVTFANIRDHVDAKLTNQTAAQLGKQPIQYDTVLTLLPGIYTIKFLARDDETGRIGTYVHKFSVPNLNNELQRVPISSVVLSSQRTNVSEALFSAGKHKVQSSNPLVQDGVRLVPSVTNVFSKARDMYIYLQAYELGATSVRPLVAYVTFFKNKTKAFETPQLAVTAATTNKLKTVILRFCVSLNKLTAGQYDCEVTVLDPTGGKATYWEAPVMLVQ